MTLEDSLAEWVRRNCRNSSPIVGSVEFEYRTTAYGEDEAIIVYWRESYRPKRGRVNGVWRYGDPVERQFSSELGRTVGDVDIMSLLREIYEILTEDSSTAQPLEDPSAAV